MKSKGYVKLYDTVQIDPLSFDKFKDNIEDNLYLSPDSSKSLRVSIAATHAGRITRNHGFYLPQKMKDGAQSLTDNFGKPMLVHHNSHDDPVGRIVGAKYIDTSGTLTRDSVQDGLIQDLCRSKGSFIQLIDVVDKLMDTDLLDDPTFPGLGYVQIDVDVSDKDAIQKILDKRYLTVSIGATTDRAICSVCKADWTEEGPCEHRPGKTYKDEDNDRERKCFIIAGNLLYDEASFVNVPADPYARVIGVNTGVLEDSLLVEESDSGITVCAGFCFQDTNTGGLSMDVDKTNPKAVNDPDDDLTEEDKNYLDMVNFAYDLALIDDDFEDKKLTSEARKKMSKGAFCKPSERQYLVNDSSHAKIAMAYAKECDEPTYVLNGIRRKAKKLGCSFGETKKDGVEVPEFELEIDAVLQDLKARKTPDEPVAKDNTDVKPDDIQLTDVKSDEETQKEMDVLKQELDDVKAERSEETKVFNETLENAKVALADMAVKLEQISGKKIEDVDKSVQETASLSIEDLLKKSKELSDSVDMDTVLEKVHDGMARVPDADIVDPTTDGVTDPTILDDDKYSRVRAKYVLIKDKKGRSEADAYLSSLIRSGLIGQDFFDLKT